MKKTSCYRNIIILLGVEDHPYCTNCSKILWTTFYPFGIEVLFFQHFEHCAQVRISKTIWESTIVYFIISGNASKEIPQKTYFFPILFFIFWQAINNRTSRANIIDGVYPKKMSSGRARAWPEHKLEPNTSLTQAWVWLKYELDPSEEVQAKHGISLNRVLHITIYLLPR